MPTPTYTPLANITLGSSAASVSFSSISQAYRDLVIVANYVSDSSNRLTVRFNSDSGTNYNLVFARGDGGSTLSGTRNSESSFRLSIGFNSNSIFMINIQDYSLTDKHKTMLVRGSDSATDVSMEACRWASTSAVTTITLAQESNNLAAGTTFALYGIAA